RATRYDIRGLPGVAREEDWDEGIVVDSTKCSGVPGAAESLRVSGIDGMWSFFLKTADERLNWSSVSNVACDSLVDSCPPAAVTEFAVPLTTMFSARVTWIASGDDGTEGAASAYDVRYATEPVTDQTWDNAVRVTGLPLPLPAGSLESHMVTGLAQDTEYFFALTSIDNQGHVSPRSIVARATTASWRRFTFSPPGVPGDYRGVWDADWSPDGSALVASAQWGESAHQGDLYVLPLNGDPIIRLTREQFFARNPSWSPDGQRIAFICSGSTWTDTLLTVDAHSGGDRRRIALSGESEGLWACSWSPDGRRIAYNIFWHAGHPDEPLTGRLGLIDLQSGESDTLLWYQGMTRPAWSPDGSHLLLSIWGGGQQSDIVSVAADGSGWAPVLMGWSSDGHPEWSPDGQRVAFSSDRSGSDEIWSMSPTGEDLVQLTSPPGEKGLPYWSPDGKTIAVVCAQDYTLDIWLLSWN
ncbi:MAG: hypothetical protein V1774_06100, partial [Candidatus Eisenbacteria bacterium]